MLDGGGVAQPVAATSGDLPSPADCVRRAIELVRDAGIVEHLLHTDLASERGAVNLRDRPAFDAITRRIVAIRALAVAMNRYGWGVGTSDDLDAACNIVNQASLPENLDALSMIPDEIESLDIEKAVVYAVFRVLVSNP